MKAYHGVILEAVIRRPLAGLKPPAPAITGVENGKPRRGWTFAPGLLETSRAGEPDAYLWQKQDCTTITCGRVPNKN
jgi:hypothetical protein